MASVLIKQGTLQKGKILVAESTYGRVRAMYDENLKIIDIATPSTPVQITGWKDLPLAGSFVAEVNNEVRKSTGIIILATNPLLFRLQINF